MAQFRGTDCLVTRDKRDLLALGFLGVSPGPAQGRRTGGGFRPPARVSHSLIWRSPPNRSPRTRQAARSSLSLVALFSLVPRYHPGANSTVAAQSLGLPGYTACGLRPT